MRGYWWSPDGDALLVARVDDAPVQRWHIADPAHPDRTPAVVAYPAAGTAERAASRCAISASTGPRVPVVLDAERDEYLAGVVWDDHGLLARRPAPGPEGAARAARSTRHRRHRPAARAHRPGLGRHRARRAGPHRRRAPSSPWPAATAADRLVVDGEPVTPPSLQVRARARRRRRDRAVHARPRTRSRSALWTWRPGTGPCARTPEPGVHSGRLRRRHAGRQPGEPATPTAPRRPCAAAPGPR